MRASNHNSKGDREKARDPDHGSVTRRSFMKFVLAAGAVTGVAALLGARARAAEAIVQGGGMLYRTLGRTGEKVSAIGMGGFHLNRPSEANTIRIIRSAIDGGINFMDNSWDYNEGISEIRLGKALRDGYRQKVFLMTKIDGRTKASATRQLDESLQRLQTDHLDLLQFHEIIRMEDPDRIFAPGGALEAVLAAQQAGKLRYIGFTGHKDPQIHLKMLRVAADHQFHFDTVQMPLNVMDAHFRSFQHQVLPVAVQEQIGVLGMKSMGDPFILKSRTVTPMECLHYAMNLPTSTVITGIDSMKILNQAFEAARTFKPMSETEVAELLSRTAKVAVNGKYELFKTSDHFDSTMKHPEWLG
ncbi:MAG: aldo/keto reductase [Pedosphaera sp.]|nr:aldo/keto reductase [Pedosphaera sp.]